MSSDSLFASICKGFAILLVAIVLLIVLMLIWDSAPAIQTFGYRFIISQEWDPVSDLFGALPFIYGTLVTSLLALLMAVPLSLGVAIFLSELSPSIIRTPIALLIELLAAIPSVIYGLWGLFYLVPWLRETIEPAIIDIFGGIPLFSGPPYGIGIFSAAIILSIMIIPIISSISRDVLGAVPNQQREAALALGATRWEMIRMSVLSYGRSGILGAIFLGLGRALGETMAVTMLIGNRADIPSSIFAPAHTMASVLANEFTEATSDLHLASLIGIGLGLFVITLVINAAARLLVWRVSRGFDGGVE